MNKTFQSWNIVFLFLLLLVGGSMELSAQVTRDSTANFQHVQAQFQQGSRRPVERMKLAGNVVIRQDSTIFYADTADILENRYLTAFGNIIIQRSDTSAAFSDSLKYDADEGVAELIHSVVLQHGKQKLFTEYLLYNLNTNTARYTSNAVLTDGTHFLSSKQGYYNTESNLVLFKDSVVVEGPDIYLRSDSIRFDALAKRVYFLGPTRIDQDSNKIYCEDGYYDLTTGDALFVSNAQYLGPERKALADSIFFESETETFTLIGDGGFSDGEFEASGERLYYNQQTGQAILEGDAIFKSETQYATGEYIEYNRKTGALNTSGRTRYVEGAQIMEADRIMRAGEDSLGRMTGNVVIQDTVAKISLHADEAITDQKNESIKAFGDSTWLSVGVEGDSLYMRADTLQSLTDSLGKKEVIGYYNVRIFKTDLQAVCDSVFYAERDSMFRLRGNPMVWSDTSQFSADVIDIQMANQAVKRIDLKGNAFILNSLDSRFYNQIKGREINIFFKDEALWKMVITGNAESVYYILDDENRYVGVNKQECSRIIMYFADNQIEDIRFYQQPTGETIPMQDVDHEAIKLDGFNWSTINRPMRFEDIFIVF